MTDVKYTPTVTFDLFFQFCDKVILVIEIIIASSKLYYTHLIVRWQIYCEAHDGKQYSRFVIYLFCVFFYYMELWPIVFIV